LKKLEGNFGSDVLSYFLFLKWMLLINLPTVMLTLGFVFVPQVLHRVTSNHTDGYYGHFGGWDLFTGEVRDSV
jgi:hypothetical protein